MTEHTKSEIEELTGLASRLINFYTTEGVVKPLSGGGGRGQAWKYSEKNRVQFHIIKSLAGFGITVQKIKLVIEKLDKLQDFKRLFRNDGSIKNGLSLDKVDYAVAIMDGGEKVLFHSVGKSDKAVKTMIMDLSTFENALIIKFSDALRD